MCRKSSWDLRAGRLAQQSSTWVDLESCSTYCADKVVPVEGDKGARLQLAGSYIEYMMNTGHKKLATLGFLRCSSPN